MTILTSSSIQLSRKKAITINIIGAATGFIIGYIFFDYLYIFLYSGIGADQIFRETAVFLIAVLTLLYALSTRRYFKRLRFADAYGNFTKYALAGVAVTAFVAVACPQTFQGRWGDGSLLNVPCVPNPGYSCTNLVLVGGRLSLKFSQNAGSTYYDIHLACSAGTNTYGYPINSSSWQAISSDGVATTGNYNGITLPSGSAIAIFNMSCYDSGGGLLSQDAMQQFHGWLWINYISNNTLPSTPNSWHTLKVAEINVKIT